MWTNCDGYWIHGKDDETRLDKVSLVGYVFFMEHAKTLNYVIDRNTGKPFKRIKCIYVRYIFNILLIISMMIRVLLLQYSASSNFSVCFETKTIFLGLDYKIRNYWFSYDAQRNNTTFFSLRFCKRRTSLCLLPIPLRSARSVEMLAFGLL